MSADIRFTGTQAARYNALTPAQRKEFHRLADNGVPVNRSLYVAQQITDEENQS